MAHASGSRTRASPASRAGPTGSVPRECADEVRGGAGGIDRQGGRLMRLTQSAEKQAQTDAGVAQSGAGVAQCDAARMGDSKGTRPKLGSNVGKRGLGAR